jgi:hypothetical protein
LVFEELRRRHPETVLCERKHPTFSDPRVAEQMRHLREVLWPARGPDLVASPWDDRFWALSLSAWHLALQEHSALKRIQSGAFGIFDCWHHRLEIKLGLKGVSPAWTRGVFAPVRQPDMIVLLDIEPSLAYERRRGAFCAYELGRWDGFEDGPEVSFCGYQEKIRRGLLRRALRDGWSIVRQQPADDVPHTLRVVLAAVDTAVERHHRLQGVG